MKRGNKRKESREKSIESILRASLELFSYKGYGSTTMEMIADKAGVSRGLPYLYFESKEKILIALLERHLQREREVIESLAHEYKSMDEFLDSFSLRFLSPFRDGPGSDAYLERRLFMGIMLLPETQSLIQDYILKFHQEIMEKYFQTISRSFSKFGIQDAKQEIQYLRMLFFGFTFSLLCMEKDFDHESILEKIKDDYRKRIQT